MCISPLTNALNKILIWLQKNYPSHVALLQPGLTESEINELLEDLPLQLPQEIRELYQWKNGSTIIGDYEDFCWAFEGWSFYSLEIVIDAYCHNLNWAPIFDNESHTSLNMFFSSPDSFANGYAVINNKQEASPIIFQYCKAGDCEQIIKYASITTMMQTVAECYEQAYYKDADEHLVPDNVKKLEIWRKYNSERIAEAALAKLNSTISLELLLEIETDLIQGTTLWQLNLCFKLCKNRLSKMMTEVFNY